MIVAKEKIGSKNLGTFFTWMIGRTRNILDQLKPLKLSNWQTGKIFENVLNWWLVGRLPLFGPSVASHEYQCL